MTSPSLRVRTPAKSLAKNNLIRQKKNSDDSTDEYYSGSDYDESNSDPKVNNVKLHPSNSALISPPKTPTPPSANPNGMQRRFSPRPPLSVRSSKSTPSIQNESSQKNEQLPQNLQSAQNEQQQSNQKENSVDNKLQNEQKMQNEPERRKKHRHRTLPQENNFNEQVQNGNNNTKQQNELSNQINEVENVEKNVTNDNNINNQSNITVQQLPQQQNLVQQVPEQVKSDTQDATRTDHFDDITYQIGYDRSLNLWKRPVHMTLNDNLVYICKSKHDKEYGRVHIVCTKNPVNKSSPHYIGLIVRNLSGSRFTVLGKSENSNSFSQLAGLAFLDFIGEDAKIRYFKVAIPEDQNYMPASKSDDLSKIAQTGFGRPGIKIFNSAIPKKHANGKLTLKFGHYQIQTSLKNFIVRDKDETPLFIIFKSTDGVCKVKARAPFTPFIAFCLAVAILTSTR